MAAKLDSCAGYMCRELWGESLSFIKPFGNQITKEEKYISELDNKSGSSLKLTVLNSEARVWTMVAGGGASVVFTDTICDIIGAANLGNYGEYSGAPTSDQTYEYAKTILQLMTKVKHKDGKILLIGGGIANFTNVASTFKGIIKALIEYSVILKNHSTKIFVRRGGPNYQEGLKAMRDL
eukprot:UC4_evm1s396